MKRLAPALLLLLSGCGLHPLYAGGSNGRVATGLAAIEIAPIAGKAGWLMHNALDERLHPTEAAEARYQLSVDLDDQIEGFGVRRDNTVTRERRTLRARFKLADVNNGTVVLDATAGSDVGIDVVSSEYATIAAEQTALEELVGEVADQIQARLALYAERGGRPRRQ